MPSVADDARLTVELTGRVQGVGLRYWVRERAGELGLRGSARNRADGRVEVIVEGPRDACERMLGDLRGGAVPGEPRDVAERWEAPSGMTGFRVD